jgi:hypothetical protein
MSALTDLGPGRSPFIFHPPSKLSHHKAETPRILPFVRLGGRYRKLGVSAAGALDEMLKGKIIQKIVKVMEPLNRA